MRSGSYSRRSKESGGLVVLGLGLVVVGYVGTFFGNLIKAAVSRQREFLADASAVQYTRNPHGIAGALMRIATHDGRSYLNNPNGMEISHALFEEGTFTRLRNLYATHPPLDERIQAILPDWDGRYDPGGFAATAKAESSPGRAEPADEVDRAAALLAGITGAIMAESILGQVGQLGSEQLERAKKVLSEIPGELLAAAHDPSAARAVVYLMVIDRDAQFRRQQLELLQRSADQGISEELATLLTKAELILREQRLSLLSISLQSLRQLSKRQYLLFKTNLNSLIRIDNKLHLFEWALLKIVNNTLDPVFEVNPPRPLGRRDLSECTEALEILFSLLAYADRKSAIDPQAAFRQAEEKLGRGLLRLHDRNELTFEKLDRALDQLAGLKPLQKPVVLKACIGCILADKSAAPIEIELLRAIGLTLDCPIPPLTID
jgi:hypothetical protein